MLNRLHFFEPASGEVNSETHSKNIQVEVLNGCGVSGVADIFTDSLRANGIDVVNIGNYRSFDIDNTIVIDRSGRANNASYVAGLLGVDNQSVVDQINKNYFLDVCVIIGKDYNKYFKN